MKIKQNASLAPLTSFGVGGKAATLATIESASDIASAIKQVGSQIWLLGYGTNVLISDYGLPGTTLLFRNQVVSWRENTVIADAGVWWDDLVSQSIDKQLWGLELTSGIPGSVGAAIYINITAYGQSQSDKLTWVEYFDESSKLHRLKRDDAEWGYKKSIFQQNQNWVISRACYQLDDELSSPLTYQSALDVADELKLNRESLKDRRTIILEARERAGSIYVPGQGHAKTVGSFFRNPELTHIQAEEIAKFDESGKTRQQILAMNKVHGGSFSRVSAAHVMLAAGFSRGQSWGNVRLHPKNLLKIENTGSATAQEIYDVAQNIMQTVKQKLDIELVPEARILGKFN